jgi:hypothetical protein
MNDNYIKVKDHPNLVRDKNSSAVLNTNRKDLDKYREEREQRLKMNRNIQKIDNLEKDISEIKSLLKILLGQKQ